MKKNGGHTINYSWLGTDVSQEFVDKYRDPVTHYISAGALIMNDRAFQLWMPVLGFDIIAGWNLLGHKYGRAKYWIQFRKSTPKNP